MLHREYAPFLPTPESIPKGPVDPPFLEAEAPRGWWEDSAAEIFNAAEQIALLLRDASECGLHLTTPFAGFCAFSAGYLCAYVHWFPKMNLERSTKSEERFGFCLEYLKKHREVWVVADGWVCKFFSFFFFFFFYPLNIHCSWLDRCLLTSPR